MDTAGDLLPFFVRETTFSFVSNPLFQKEGQTILTDLSPLKVSIRHKRFIKSRSEDMALCYDVMCVTYEYIVYNI